MKIYIYALKVGDQFTQTSSFFEIDDDVYKLIDTITYQDMSSDDLEAMFEPPKPKLTTKQALVLAVEVMEQCNEQPAYKAVTPCDIDHVIQMAKNAIQSDKGE